MATSETNTRAQSMCAVTSTAKLEERHFHLCGYPIQHSLSPLLHATVFAHFQLPWTYELQESTDLDRLVKILRSPKTYGSSITMPHKVSITKGNYLDDITEEGREVGACNTVFVRETTDDATGTTHKKYIGTNTDVIGIREALIRAVENPEQLKNKPALVVGGGGAARSAVYALHKYLHATQIYLVNRDASEVEAVISECTARGFGANLQHVVTAAEAAALPTPAAVVACVPDFPPVTHGEIEARNATEAFLSKPEKGVWLEMAYHPRIMTALAVKAKDAGWNLVPGTEAMIWQGLEQDRLWTEREIDTQGLARVRQVVNKAVELSNAASH